MSGESYQCLCGNPISEGECSKCGLSRLAARYLSVTGPFLPVIMLTGMGIVFFFNYYGITEKVTEVKENVMSLFTPHTDVLPGKSVLVQPEKTPLPTGSPIPVKTKKVDETGGVPDWVYGETEGAEVRPSVKSEEPEKLPKRITETPPANHPLTPALQEKKIYQILHFLVGRNPEGESVNTLFAEEVVNLSLDMKTSREAVRDSINQFISEYPVRVVKLTSAGVKDRTIEINTRRIFMREDGARLDVYGKTVVELDGENRINALSDDVQQDFPTRLSEGFAPINYSLKKTISNAN